MAIEKEVTLTSRERLEVFRRSFDRKESWEYRWELEAMESYNPFNLVLSDPEIEASFLGYFLEEYMVHRQGEVLYLDAHQTQRDVHQLLTDIEGADLVLIVGIDQLAAQYSAAYYDRILDLLEEKVRRSQRVVVTGTEARFLHRFIRNAHRFVGKHTSLRTSPPLESIPMMATDNREVAPSTMV